MNNGLTKARCVRRQKAKGKDIKKDVANICQRLYPTAEIYTPKGRLMDGRSDALMIAHYCMIHYK